MKTFFVKPLLGLGFGVAMLSGCGGGDNTSNNGNSSQGVITPYTTSAATLAAKQSNYATPFAVPDGVGAGCSNVTNTTVYVLPNTIVYAANGVSELSQQQVAEYSEQAVSEIRATLGLSATTGFIGSKIKICVQGQLFYGVAQGIGGANGFSVVSTDSPSLDRGFLVNNFDMYRKLTKHELVHTYQLSTLAGGVRPSADTWFTEGLAEYIASGKSNKNKNEILSLATAQNPVAVTTNSGTDNLKNYPAFQSTVAYLFEQNGAKNSLTIIPTFLATLHAKTAAIIATCTGTVCMTAARDGFVQAFEATFKEADGTAMKLRNGTNNLQDTIITRLTSFL
jgi:hypothetical protein